MKCKKCKRRDLSSDDFEIKVARGKLYRRGTCKECIKAYFRQRGAGKRKRVSLLVRKPYTGRRALPCRYCGAPSPDGVCDVHGR